MTAEEVAMGPTDVQPGTVTLVVTPGVNPGVDGPPKTNLIISIISFLCCNCCCLGLVALIFAISSNSAMTAGDLEKARRQGETAGKLAKGAIIATIIAFLLAIALSIVANKLGLYGG